MPEHHIVTVLRDTLVKQASREMPNYPNQLHFPAQVDAVAEQSLKMHLGELNFRFSTSVFGNLSSFTLSENGSRIMVFESGMGSAEKVAHILHYLGHLQAGHIPENRTWCQLEPRDRNMIQLESDRRIERTADNLGRQLVDYVLFRADVKNLLARGLVRGSQRISFLGKT